MSVKPTSGRKIAVLGSGIGALSAVYELLKAEPTAQVTVYQMGWRLGGKGASGRNMQAGYGHRIEEHGLHMWSGLYENAFRIMRECYGALARPAGAPLATWQDAFKPHSSIVLYELYKGAWKPWTIQAPTNAELPGDPHPKLELSLWDYAYEALTFIFGARLAVDGAFGSVVHGLLTITMAVLRAGVSIVFLLLQALHLLGLAERVLLWSLRLFMRLFWWEAQRHLDNDAMRRAWLIANFGYGNLHGALAEGVMTKGLNRLDEYDYRDWLRRYIYPDPVPGVEGGSLTLASPLVQFLYDAQFSYLNGDLRQPNIAAGASLRTLVRMAFTCKGAVLWRMQAAMGDAVFTPLYQLLTARGVQFKFFHQIKALTLSADGQRVARIEGLVQAELKPGVSQYQPLIPVKGLDCWPAEPLWDQLAGGDAARAAGVDYESYCFRGGQPFTLTDGVDFNEIIFGIPVGGIPYVAGDLVRQNPAWKALVDNLATVRTQAVQTWFKVPRGSLGVPGGDQPLVVTYHPTPLNTMADMTFLTEHEAWPAAPGRYPLSQFYFCGPLADPHPPQPSPVGPVQTCEQMHEAHAREAVLRNAQTLFSTLATPLFPLGTLPPQQPGAPLDLQLLIADAGAATPEERLRAQYLRANVSPSERFTLTNAGSTKYRLAPGGSGFANLKLAGDWTANGFNIANIEATVTSGMLCSQALCGLPLDKDITGLNFGG